MAHVLIRDTCPDEIPSLLSSRHTLQPASERRGNNFNGSHDSHLIAKTQNLALTAICVLSSLDSGRVHTDCFAGRRLYRGTLLIRNSFFLDPYSRTKHRVFCWSLVRRLSLMSEVPL